MSKTLPRTSRLLVIITLGTGACGGGGKGQSYPDASSFGTGGKGGGAPTGAAGSGGTPTGGSGGSVASTGGTSIVFPGSGGSGTAAGGAPGTVVVPPAAGSSLLFPGTALLMGPGTTCSSVPSTVTPNPDRWCGVFVPSGNQKIGLVVIDVTKALGGATITCNTGDANCVPLNASIDATNTDASYTFFGQTLIYYDATTIYAWRPGWTAGRALIAHSSTQPARCQAALDDSPNAICLSSTNNLYAGSVAAQAGGILPLVDSLANGSTGIGFAPDGKSLIWSVKSASTGASETLKMQAFADPTTKKTIATNVTGWAVSSDATRWYWLSAPVTDATTMNTTGTLQMAPYPAGTTPATIQAKVGQFASFGTKSVVTLTTSTAGASGADMNVIADVDNPTASTTVVEAMDVAGMVALDDAGSIVYATMAKQPDPTSNNFLVDLRVIKTDGTGKCTVAATPTADPGASFNRTGSAVEWVQVTVDASGKVTAASGQLTTLADCAPHTFSSTLYSFYDVTPGLVIQQNFDAVALTGDIAFAAVDASGVPGMPALVQKAADGVIEPLFPAPGRVLFTLSSGSSADGVYASPAVPGAAPLTAPRARGLAPTSLVERLTGQQVNGAQLARARFASSGGAAIPRLIAAPTALGRPLAGKAFTLPFARGLSAPPLRSGLTR